MIENDAFKYILEIPMKEVAKFIRNREKKSSPKEISFWFPKGISLIDGVELHFKAPIAYKYNNTYAVYPNFAFLYNPVSKEFEFKSGIYVGGEKTKTAHGLLTVEDKKLRNFVKSIDWEKPEYTFNFDPANFFKNEKDFYKEVLEKYPQLSIVKRYNTTLIHPRVHLNLNPDLTIPKETHFATLTSYFDYFEKLPYPTDLGYSVVIEMHSEFPQLLNQQSKDEIEKDLSLITFKAKSSTPFPLNLMINVSNYAKIETEEEEEEEEDNENYERDYVNASFEYAQIAENVNADTHEGIDSYESSSLQTAFNKMVQFGRKIEAQKELLLKLSPKLGDKKESIRIYKDNYTDKSGKLSFITEKDYESFSFTKEDLTILLEKLS